MKKFYLSIILASIACCVFPKNLAFRHIDTRDGLSQINILSIYQDETGAMWFGSSEGLNRYDGRDITIFRPSPTNEGLTQNEINTICGNKKGIMYIRSGIDLVKYDLHKDQFTCLLRNNVNDIHYDNDTLWIATNNKILFLCEKENKLCDFYDLKTEWQATKIYSFDKNTLLIGHNKIYKIKKDNPNLSDSYPIDDEVKTFYKDKNGNLWIGTSLKGLYMISPRQEITNFTQSANNNSISNNTIRSIIEDDLGNLWVGTFYGLNKYDPINDEWESYTQTNVDRHNLSHTSIFALYKDVQGTIWIGTYFGGVNYFNPEKDAYNIYGANMTDPYSVSYPFVGKMTEDKEGNLWICTEGGGLNYFNRKTQIFTKYLHRSGDDSSITHNNLKAIWHDPQGERLYIGTHTGGLSVYDIPANKFRTLKHNPSDIFSLPNDIVNEMQYYKGNLIILTQRGISKMDLSTEKFYPILENKNAEDILSRQYMYETFYIDSQDKLWLALSRGGLIRVDLKTNNIEEYLFDASDKSGIGKFKIVKIFESSQRRLFFGSTGSGLFEYKPETNSFTNYTAENKDILGNYCYYIAELPYKYLVILHNRGATFFNPVTSKLQNSYEFGQMSFNQGSSVFITKDEEMFFGGNSGLVLLNEKILKTSTADFNMYFNNLLINNKEILPGDNSKILNKAIMFTDKLTLKYNQNNIILGFASSEYISSEYFQYEYNLEGFSDEWLPLPSNNQITYTNLSPGDYILKVRVLQQANEPIKEIAIGIVINLPFYATIWAYLFYFILIFSIIYFIIRFKTRQSKLETSLRYERKDKERIEELNKAKLQFFTNISHEFRTPLTLIIGQFEALLSSDKLSPSVYNKLLRVYKNAIHLRSLITELLDFRKQEQGYLELKVEETNIVPFVNEIFISFYEYAQKKNINYVFEDTASEITAWFDPVQMQKVIYNILSNAFKYTKEGGNIKVSFIQDENNVEIHIQDTGVGISKEYLDKIFDRFYQIDGDSTRLTLGTGIGLALTKGIVELHHGKIHVESEVNVGSTFIISLPLGNAHFTEKEMARETIDKASIPDDYVFREINDIIINSPQKEEPVAQTTEEQLKMLIVEDNEELSDMLEEIMSPFYQIHRASNGLEGLEITKEIQPDIIVSDVMMPVMSGKEMCHKIKNDINISHIPVILLTAQTSIEYTIEGYMFGADDYITKPFNSKLLILRCNNLIQSRKSLIEKYRSTEYKSSIVVETADEQDKKLIEKTKTIIEQNFSNPDFNMDNLATELGMGRSKLYAKIKEITGLTPNEFTLKLKLDEGMKLLNEHAHLSISEIAYMLGFSSARYFSLCFKSFYGVAPLSVRKSKKN